MMTVQLLAYIGEDFADADVAALADVVAEMRPGAEWTLDAPQLVDEVDETSCSAPEDQPIRTTGVLLQVSEPGESPSTAVGEVEAFFKAVSAFSRTRRLSMEVQLGDTFVGDVTAGELGDGIREGSLEAW